MFEGSDFSDVSIPLVYAFLKSIHEDLVLKFTFKFFLGKLFTSKFAFISLDLYVLVDDQFNLWNFKVLLTLGKVNLKL